MCIHFGANRSKQISAGLLDTFLHTKRLIIYGQIYGHLLNECNLIILTWKVSTRGGHKTKQNNGLWTLGAVHTVYIVYTVQYTVLKCLFYWLSICGFGFYMSLNWILKVAWSIGCITLEEYKMKLSQWRP